MLSFKKKRVEKRSPLKAPPLRLPGQSVQEEIDKIFEKFSDVAIYVGMMTFLAILEWMRYFHNSPPQPVLYSLIAVPFWIYGIWRGVGFKRKLRNLKQARDGERSVGQSLERLREKGYRVLHDMVGKGFNVDHLLIGPTGVYTVETKTISKPSRGSCEITYDGEHVRINGFQPDRDPVIQAKAQANWVRGLVHDSTGKSIDVRPVVLYPGWFVKKQCRVANVWVINPDQLESYLKNEQQVLGPSDIHSVEYAMTFHMRNASNGK